MNKKMVAVYLENKPEAWLDHPFGPQAAVYKIKDKLFALLTSLKTANGTVDAINLKCDPDQAAGLRDMFSGVIPGYHMNKKHWNSVLLDDSVPASEIERMIDHSYALVVKSLKAVERNALILKYGEAAVLKGL